MTYGFRSWLDSSAEGTAPLRIVTSATGDLEVVAAELKRSFDADPAVQRIELVVDGNRLGMVTRTRLRELLSKFERSDPGAGDGATLPGRSSQYTVLTYRCGTCGVTAKLLFVDEVPECVGHGPMDRVS
ncbi:hypothetical protein G7043_41190 [Lentzea sp. NEAU-D13]|uniref:Uncharacterized protein n=1 Tax=Lentzea alba TaxID=2714351 RepID=A0A7C9RXH0_9PSEU|nr:hypothetical protein [Lentzea alba]NGY65329.1 hypothetical protein [Lentzea alba]